MLVPKALAQDSIVYHQSKLNMFSNKYVFFSNGTFKHYYQTDDGQLWYGFGEFEDKGRIRILKFKDPDLTMKIDYMRIHYEANFNRKLVKRANKFKSKDFYNTTRNKSVFFEEATTMPNSL